MPLEVTGITSSRGPPAVFQAPPNLATLPQLWPPGTPTIRAFKIWSHDCMLLLQGPGWHLRQKATKPRAELLYPFSLLSFPYAGKNCVFNWMMPNVQLDQRLLWRTIFAIFKWRDKRVKASWNHFLGSLTPHGPSCIEDWNMLLISLEKSPVEKHQVQKPPWSHTPPALWELGIAQTKVEGTKQKRGTGSHSNVIIWFAETLRPSLFSGQSTKLYSVEWLATNWTI